MSALLPLWLTPTPHELRHARAVLESLTSTQRRALVVVVLYAVRHGDGLLGDIEAELADND